MALSDDIASDMETFDGLETITLFDQSANVSNNAVSALRRNLSFQDVVLGGNLGLESTSTNWHIQANTTNIAPQEGDRITSAGGVNHTVLSVNFDTFTTRYKCVCNLQQT